MTKKYLIAFIILLSVCQILLFLNKQEETKSIIEKIQPKEIIVNITKPEPEYLSYSDLINHIKKWQSEATDLVDVCSYGFSSKNKELYYIRIFNKQLNSPKPVVLITACIHGNEPLSTSTTVWYIGNLLKQYNSEIDIKDLINSRDIYFVPVVSPDSYPHSRHVDGVDPNRDFPSPSNPDHTSVVPVRALQDLYLKIKPKAVLSGHTYGRVFLTPHGDTMQKCKDHEEFLNIVGKMATMANYKCIRACELYGGTSNTSVAPVRVYGEKKPPYNVSVPIYGTEIDWYYRNGCFPIVMEFGTHQRKPDIKEIQYEYERTWKAFLCFLKEAPLIEINPETKTLLSHREDGYGEFGDE